MTLVQIMFWAILGHFVGDYLLQSKKTAQAKSMPGISGWMSCLSHCVLYAAAVCLAVQIGTGRIDLVTGWSPLVFVMVLLTHLPIDRWSLAGWWLKLIGGRPLFEFQGVLREPGAPTIPLEVMASQHAFAAIVYTVVDNTLHILLMTAGFAALLYRGVI